MATKNQQTLVPITGILDRTTYLRLKGHLAKWDRNLAATPKGAELTDRVREGMCVGRLLVCIVDLLDAGEFELGTLEVTDD